MSLQPGEIRDLGFKRVRIDSVSFVKKDIAEREKQPHVTELAKSRKDVAMSPPTVNKTSGGLVLLAGRDRIAADLLNKETFVWVKVVQTDSIGARRIEREENLKRRSDAKERDRLLAEEVEDAKKTILADEKKSAAEAKDAPGKADKPSEKAVRGRKKTIETKAREKVAAKHRTTPEAVRKATERAKKASEPEKPAKAPINAHGHALSASLIGSVTAIQAAIDGIDKHVRQALAEATKLAGTAGAPSLADVTVALQGAGARIRAMRPDSVCLTCKGKGKDCTGCGGRGWVTKSSGKDVPEELKAPPTPPNGEGKNGLNIVIEAAP